MGSIATTRGDGGQTGLAGGIRVSKASRRVDTYGTVDELISVLGFARSICGDSDISEFARGVQRELFTVGSALATPPDSSKPEVPVEPAMVERLTAEVHRLEAIDGMLSDWSVSGANTTAAAFDVARTVCRRAERGAVKLSEDPDHDVAAHRYRSGRPSDCQVQSPDLHQHRHLAGRAGDRVLDDGWPRFAHMGPRLDLSTVRVGRIRRGASAIAHP